MLTGAARHTYLRIVREACGFNPVYRFLDPACPAQVHHAHMTRQCHLQLPWHSQLVRRQVPTQQSTTLRMLLRLRITEMLLMPV